MIHLLSIPKTGNSVFEHGGKGNSLRAYCVPGPVLSELVNLLLRS